MTREELIEMAQAARKRGAFLAVSQEELDALPVKQEEKYIAASNKEVHVFEFKPENQPHKKMPMLINFHGGGFIKGRADRDQVYCSNIADRTGSLVWDVDYVLAPEYPFPAAVNECYDIIAYAFAQADRLNVDTSRIVLAGHSAGSNLIAAACIKNAESRAFKPAAMILDYIPANQMINPFCKLSPDQYGDERKMARAGMEKLYLDFYMKPEEAVSPLASPILASEEVLGTFPDCLVITAGEDSLRDEGEAFAAKLAASGVNVTARRFRNSMHGFTINRNGEWKEALKLHETFIYNYSSGRRENL